MNEDLPNPREQLEQRVTALILGELSPAEAHEITAELERDPSLRSFYERMRRTVELVTATTAMPAPSDVPGPRLSAERRQALLAKFQEPAPAPEPSRRFKIVPGFFPLGLAASILICLAASFWFLLHGRPGLQEKSYARRERVTDSKPRELSAPNDSIALLHKSFYSKDGADRGGKGSPTPTPPVTAQSPPTPPPEPWGASSLDLVGKSRPLAERSREPAPPEQGRVDETRRESKRQITDIDRNNARATRFAIQPPQASPAPARRPKEMKSKEELSAALGEQPLSRVSGLEKSPANVQLGFDDGAAKQKTYAANGALDRPDLSASSTSPESRDSFSKALADKVTSAPNTSFFRARTESDLADNNALPNQGALERSPQGPIGGMAGGGAGMGGGQRGSAAGVTAGRGEAAGSQPLVEFEAVAPAPLGSKRDLSGPVDSLGRSNRGLTTNALRNRENGQQMALSDGAVIDWTGKSAVTDSRSAQPRGYAYAEGLEKKEQEKNMTLGATLRPAAPPPQVAENFGIRLLEANKSRSETASGSISGRADVKATTPLPANTPETITTGAAITSLKKEAAVEELMFKQAALEKPAAGKPAAALPGSLPALGIIAAPAASAGPNTGGVYSANAVGYVNLSLKEGFNLFSHPLNGTNNHLSTIDSVAGAEIIPATSLHLHDADLPQVLAAYQALSGWSVVPSTGLKDPVKVTFDSQEPLTPAQAIQALDGILALNQITMIPAPGGKTVKATPFGRGFGEAPPFNTNDNPSPPRDWERLPTNTFVTQVVSVKNKTPSQLLQALQPLSQTPNATAAIDSSHLIILRDSPENVRRMVDQINESDVAPAPERTLTPKPEQLTQNNPFSTFSLNVSDVSFKLAAASLAKEQLPEPSTIRSEEFVNAFNYHDPAPTGNARLAFAWEQAHSPWDHQRELVRFSIQTAARGREPGRPLNLVLLLDNSGSMERADRVRIVREALRVLAEQLTAADRISVVTFARTPRLWIDGLAGDQREELLNKVGALNPEGGTNLEDALALAYATAEKHLQPASNNRVILMTDGAANLGNVDPGTLQKTVDQFRKRNVALDCFGIGWDGYNDPLLETLSRHGDGRYGFLNHIEEVRAGFAEQLAGALQVAAADVKAQVEFNPQRVVSYRQIGYDLHQLTKEQFRDNTVDAAEIGAAEGGTALYAVQVNRQGTGPLGVVRVRFKVPATGAYEEQEWILPYNPAVAAFDQASPTIRLAGVAAAFAEWLARSPYAANVTLPDLQRYLSGVSDNFGTDARPKELTTMLTQARTLSGQ